LRPDGSSSPTPRPRGATANPLLSLRPTASSHGAPHNPTGNSAEVLSLFSPLSCSSDLPDLGTKIIGAARGRVDRSAGS
jgi:hypothetical protein